jgi:hypothetical protein
MPNVLTEREFHISDFNNAWNKKALQLSRDERYNLSIEQRNERLQRHRTNECMILYGNFFQKIYYSIRDLI